MILQLVICCFSSFLIGSLPFGYLAGRLVLKDDIRRHGSGNIGATNVTRVLGWKWGIGVLVLDAIKGLLPVLATGQVIAVSHPEIVQPSQIAAGVAAIFGHMFPVWLGFRGGKGVATALGVVLVLSPVASAVATLVFALTFAASRIVGLGSMLAALAFAVAHFVMLKEPAFVWPAWPMSVFAILMPLLIIWRHRSNLLRLWRGEERPLTPAGTPGSGTGERSGAP